MYFCKNYLRIFFFGRNQLMPNSKIPKMFCFYPGRPGFQRIWLFCSCIEAKSCFSENYSYVALGKPACNFDLIVAVATRDLPKLGKFPIFLVAPLQNLLSVFSFSKGLYKKELMFRNYIRNKVVVFCDVIFRG